MIGEIRIRSDQANDPLGVENISQALLLLVNVLPGRHRIALVELAGTVDASFVIGEGHLSVLSGRLGRKESDGP